jgi:hypothetical protein
MSKKETNLDSLTETLYKKVPRLALVLKNILKKKQQMTTPSDPA